MLPQESSSGRVDISFGEADEAVVDQLWVDVGPIITRLVVMTEALVSCFGVRAEERSTLMRLFNLPSDLLEVYLTFFPRELGGTDSGDGNNDEETYNGEDGEYDADKSDLEDTNLDRLMMQSVWLWVTETLSLTRQGTTLLQRRMTLPRRNQERLKMQKIFWKMNSF